MSTGDDAPVRRIARHVTVVLRAPAAYSQERPSVGTDAGHRLGVLRLRSASTESPTTPDGKALGAWLTAWDDSSLFVVHA